MFSKKISLSVEEAEAQLRNLRERIQEVHATRRAGTGGPRDLYRELMGLLKREDALKRDLVAAEILAAEAVRDGKKGSMWEKGKRRVPPRESE